MERRRQKAMKNRSRLEKARNLLSRAENKIISWTEKYKIILITDILFGIIVYFMMLSENLVNSVDGIWHTSRFIAGAWETSLGRGMLYFFDKLRGGLISMPLIATLTLLLISTSISLFLDLYSVREKGMGLLISLLLIASPVTCITLSHCYMAVDFGLAFLFSVIAVKCIISKYKIVGIVFGGVFIAISMGCYQAYFGMELLVFCS